jgi:hypothetical protein
VLQDLAERTTRSDITFLGTSTASPLISRAVQVWRSRKSFVVTKATPPIPFAGSQLDDTRHVCAFFKDGFVRGERAIHLINSEQYAPHLEAALESGQLDVRVNTDAYLRDGHLDQDRMLASFEKMASGSVRSGYPLSRIICSMNWAYNAPSHLHELFEFESRVNDVWRRHEDAVICVYDLKRIGGDIAIDMMRTHPMIVIGGMLQQNPFYVPPQEFLREFRQRRAAHTVLAD